MISNSLPDLYRYRITELPLQKVLAGVSLVTLICLGLFAANYALPESATSLAKIYFFLQGLVWVVWAPTQCASAVSSERADRTWDFQRLTPLSSGQTALGRLLGAPLFAYMLGFLILPWGALSLLFTDRSFVGTWALGQLGLVAVTLLCNSAALMLSANPSIKSGRANLAVGSIIGLILLMILTSLLNVSATLIPPTEFYSMKLNPGWVFNMTALVFGLWMFFAAKWQIGRDYLEQRKAWRFPAFLFFTAAYFNGLLSPESFSRYVMVGAAILVFGAAMLQLSEDTFTLKAWYHRFRTKMPNAFQAIPIWVTGWSAIAVIAIVFSIVHRSMILIPLLAFSLRDLLILEASRFMNFKQARTFALSLVLCLYVVPLFFIPLFAPVIALTLPIPVWAANLYATDFSYVSLQAYDKGLLYNMNLASGVIGAVIAGGLLLAFQGRRRES